MMFQTLQTELNWVGEWSWGIFQLTSAVVGGDWIGHWHLLARFSPTVMQEMLQFSLLEVLIKI